MNENTIETILRQSPRVRTPSGLLEKLTNDIQLPERSATTCPTHMETNRPSSNGLRRWLPALGFALWFLGCIVVFGIQANRIAELREQRHALESSKAASVQQALAADTLRATAEGELERLKQELADVQRLRAEMEQLRADAQELTTLKAQNQQLHEELRSQTAPPPKPEEDFFALATMRAERTRCVNSLKRLGLAARIWVNDKKGDFMPDRATLKAALPTIIMGRENPMHFEESLLFCPSDGVTSYEIVSPSSSEDRPETIFSRCPIHNIYGLCDGSVQQIDPKQFEMVKKDGVWILQKR